MRIFILICYIRLFYFVELSLIEQFNFTKRSQRLETIYTVKGNPTLPVHQYYNQSTYHISFHYYFSTQFRIYISYLVKIAKWIPNLHQTQSKLQNEFRTYIEFIIVLGFHGVWISQAEAFVIQGVVEGLSVGLSQFTQVTAVQATHAYVHFCDLVAVETRRI